MLDTNTVSYFIKNSHAHIRSRLQEISIQKICISAITQAELLRGIERKPEATKLASIVNSFLSSVDSLAWGSAEAKAYAMLKTKAEKEGKSLSALDMLIASHSLAADTILVTNDSAFWQLQHLLQLEDWTEPVNSNH